jgi:hypothetical protein
MPDCSVKERVERERHEAASADNSFEQFRRKEGETWGQ